MSNFRIVESGKDFSLKRCLDLPFRKFAPVLKNSSGTEYTCSSVSDDGYSVQYTYQNVEIDNDIYTLYLVADRESNTLEINTET